MVGTVGKASSPATVHVVKIEAARRQIDAAIRMTFLNEDDLAIHTVASAGYKNFSGFIEQKGAMMTPKNYYKLEFLKLLGDWRMGKCPQVSVRDGTIMRLNFLK